MILQHVLREIIVPREPGVSATKLTSVINIDRMKRFDKHSHSFVFFLLGGGQRGMSRLDRIDEMPLENHDVRRFDFSTLRSD